LTTHIADIPKPFYCYVQDEFLYDHQEGHGSKTQCLVYGISALPARAWGFSVLLQNGALVQHIPLHALTTEENPSHDHPLDHLQPWSCFGYSFAAHEYCALSELPVKAYLKGGVWENGRYLFSAAPYDDTYSSTPDQHKHYNFIALDCGRIAALPGNRILVYDSSFVTIPAERPKYRTNTRVWYTEEFGDDSAFDETIQP
jgi:hypothetical protein